MASASAIPKSDILGLFRSLLRTSKDFKDYNIREYAKRRTVDGFRDNRHLADASSVSAAYRDGITQLEVARRQAAIYSSYAPKVRSVMELK